MTPAFLLVAAATFFAFLSIGVVLPVLPRYAEGPLGAGSIGVGIAVAAASLTALLAQPPAGRLGDLRGRRPLMVGGGVLMVAGAAGLVVAEHIVPVVGLRLLTGVGEALFLIGGLSIVNDLAPDHRRGEALSLYTLASYSGLAVGPVVGELALGDERWDTVWLLAAGAAATAGVLGLRSPETRPAAKPSEGSSWLPHRLGLLPGLVLGLGLFGMGGFLAFVTLYALDIGLDGAGPLFALFAVVVVAIRSLGAKIPDRVGPARTVRIALVALAAGLATMGLWQEPIGLYVGTFVFSVGQALAFPAVMTLAMARTPAGDRGAVAGTVTAFVDVAIATGAIALGGVADLGGYPAVFLVAAVVAGSALVVLQRLGEASPAGDARI